MSLCDDKIRISLILRKINFLGVSCILRLGLLCVIRVMDYRREYHPSILLQICQVV